MWDFAQSECTTAGIYHILMKDRYATSLAQQGFLKRDL